MLEYSHLPIGVTVVLMTLCQSSFSSASLFSFVSRDDNKTRETSTILAFFVYFFMFPAVA